ncbi:MAG: hypothetical protein KU37_06285 [Sulfuricurvum sp. PC08-66]|nr:MAG: hypothetical protein KU37_06285 [Sulfuricurvum sp. PC08-66]
MLKPLVLLWSLLGSLGWALTLDVQSGKEQGEQFATLHLREATPFVCKESIDTHDVITKVECFFDKAPTKTFQEVRNLFFVIQSYETPTQYVISIAPLKRIKLFPMTTHLSRTKEIVRYDAKTSQHWMVLGYNETMPLAQSRPVPRGGLSFPIRFARSELPYVGALGLDGVPLDMEQVEDVGDYLEIRNLYTKEQYEEVLQRIARAEEANAASIFQSEFLLYKIRTLYRLDDSSAVVDLAKEFLRLYSSDEAVPEVLLMISNSASSLGLVIDAEYFYDRLLTEHYDSPYATQGLIDLGAHALNRGDAEQATRHLKKALEKAEDKALASQAAMKLVQLFIARGNAQEAAYYMQKIADGNLEYLLADVPNSFELAQEMAKLEAPKEAATVMEPIFGAIDNLHDSYEGILYQMAVWFDEANANEKAYHYYKKYLELYAYGEHVADVDTRIDKVLFEMGDENVTKQLELYATIETKYAAEEIAQDALFNRAKLLLQERRYQEVLALKESLMGLTQEKFASKTALLLEAATAAINEALDAPKCQEALKLSATHEHNLTVPYDVKLYGCAMQESMYATAATIAQPYTAQKSLEERLAWSYRYVKAKAKTGDDKEVFVVGTDVVSMAKMAKKESYQDVLYDLFKSSVNLNEREKSIDYITQIESTFGLLFKDIELYTLMARSAKNNNDSAMIETYATKVVTLQRQHKSYTQSPAIEFLLLKALKENSKNDKAYALLKELVGYVNEGENGARAYYELGAMAQKMGDKSAARSAFESSVKANATSPWGKLSSDALKLF